MERGPTRPPVPVGSEGSSNDCDGRFHHLSGKRPTAGHAPTRLVMRRGRCSFVRSHPVPGPEPGGGACQSSPQTSQGDLPRPRAGSGRRARGGEDAGVGQGHPSLRRPAECAAEFPPPPRSDSLCLPLSLWKPPALSVCPGSRLVRPQCPPVASSVRSVRSICCSVCSVRSICRSVRGQGHLGRPVRSLVRSADRVTSSGLFAPAVVRSFVRSAHGQGHLDRPAVAVGERGGPRPRRVARTRRGGPWRPLDQGTWRCASVCKHVLKDRTWLGVTCRVHGASPHSTHHREEDA